MATKVEPVSSVEPRRTVMTTSSVAPSGSPKVSMFGKKSGFVIPKNKLSGSLVPTFRGGSKTGDAAKEESNKQVQRKTKWGADLTQDASVRKGRALAYQLQPSGEISVAQPMGQLNIIPFILGAEMPTRVEQITQQLNSGMLKTEDDQEKSLTEVSTPESTKHRSDDQRDKIDMLELEKREAIGEILKLNPNYKAPADYKPLLKEAKVPIPLKRHPGYNFIGLILGSGSNTQKRLEEETGAKIRIYGTKVGATEKVEITMSDGNEAQSAYEELYVHVSADTFEKVDAAVSLIELLVTPVSGVPTVASTNPTTASGDSVDMLDPSKNAAAISTSYMMPNPDANQGFMQPMMRPTQPGPVQAQFQQYRGPWFPPGPPQTAMHPPSGFPPSTNNPAPMPNSAMQFPPSAINPSNMRPFYGGQPQPNTSAGFNTDPRLSFYAPRQQQPPLMQGMQRPYMPDTGQPRQGFPPGNQPIQNLQNPPAYSMPSRPNSAMPHQLMGNQPITSHNGWSGVPLASPASQGSSNMMHMTRQFGPSNVPTAAGNASSTGNSFPSHSSSWLPGPPVHHSATGLTSASRPHPPASAQLLAPPMAGPSPAQLSVFPQATSPHLSRGPIPNLSANLVPLGSAPVPLASPQQPGPATPVPGSLPTFTPIKPPMTSPGSIAPVSAPRPQRPNSGDFTFQPVRPQLPASQTSSGPSNQSAAQIAVLMSPTAVQTFPVPQAPSFRAVIPFAGNSPPIQPPPRAMSFGNPNSVAPRSPVPQLGPQMHGFIPPRQMSNSPGSFPPQPVNPLQLQQNQLASMIRPGNILVPNQQISTRENEVYDPLSPTSASPAPPQKEDPVKAKNIGE